VRCFKMKVAILSHMMLAKVLIKRQWSPHGATFA
jgi:hypothetical protein